MEFAYAWRSGLLQFGPKVPGGALAVAEILSPEDRETVERLARIAYDGESLLVPGIPEAQSDDEAESALIAFADRIRDRLEA